MNPIDIIYKNLMNGMTYGYVIKNVRFPYFHNALYKGRSIATKKFFIWNNYGSSANKATKKDLKWIIEVIFKMTPEEFINHYECRKWEDTYDVE